MGNQDNKMAVNPSLSSEPVPFVVKIVWLALTSWGPSSIARSLNKGTNWHYQQAASHAYQLMSMISWVPKSACSARDVSCSFNSFMSAHGFYGVKWGGKPTQSLPWSLRRAPSPRFSLTPLSFLSPRVALVIRCIARVWFTFGFP